MDVERPLHARVSGRDVEGEPVTIEASGLEARVLQHEIDHLDGVLILDRTARDQRKGALRALREGGSYSPPVEDERRGRRRATASRAPTREDRLPRHLGASPPRSCAAWPTRRTGPQLVVTPPDRRQGPRAQELAAAGRRGWPRELGIELLQAENVNEEARAGADPRGATRGGRSSAPSAS